MSKQTLAAGAVISLWVLALSYCGAVHGDRFTTLVESADQLIFEYFGINPTKVEAERQRLLSAIRNPT